MEVSKVAFAIRPIPFVKYENGIVENYPQYQRFPWLHLYSVLEVAS